MYLNFSNDCMPALFSKTVADNTFHRRVQQGVLYKNMVTAVEVRALLLNNCLIKQDYSPA
jgi:hypothetical protein